jgi:hypothetical protein
MSLHEAIKKGKVFGAGGHMIFMDKVHFIYLGLGDFPVEINFMPVRIEFFLILVDTDKFY